MVEACSGAGSPPSLFVCNTTCPDAPHPFNPTNIGKPGSAQSGVLAQGTAQVVVNAPSDVLFIGMGSYSLSTQWTYRMGITVEPVNYQLVVPSFKVRMQQWW